MRVPLAIAFALYAAIAARYDMQPAGPTYHDRELLKALKAVAPKPVRKRR